MTTANHTIPDHIPDDYTLLKTSHLNDLRAIASSASREDIIAAIRWHDSYSAVDRHGKRGRDARRKVLYEALQSDPVKKGGRP